MTYYTPYGSLSTSFAYDDNGNIASISRNGTVLYSYEYDGLNQLVREDDRIGNKTVIYTYDTNGNIQSKKYYALSIGTATANLSAPIDTVNYGYSSSTRDVIASYDGQSISTDYRGNITSWNGKSFVWQGGNQLASITDGSNTYSYTYNSDGLRTSKTVNGVTTNYYWVDGKLMAQTTGDNILLFRYDADGNPLSFNYNGAEYFYVLNTQGDISAIMNMSGVTVAFYYYDAGGNVVSIQDYSGNEITSSSHIANINPIRYRGYYYDSEIEMYYLQSRYYSPELYRFISSDEALFLGVSGTVLGYNLFSYCENNAVNNCDPSGYFTITRWMIAVPIDMILMAIPVIGGVFAPIKALAKKLGQNLLKKSLKTPLVKFINVVAKFVGKIVSAIKGAVVKVPFIGKWIAKKIPSVSKIGNIISGTTASVTINKLLDVIIPNITVFLSVGGLVSGLLDWAVDKKLDNKIWTF